MYYEFGERETGPFFISVDTGDTADDVVSIEMSTHDAPMITISFTPGNPASQLIRMGAQDVVDTSSPFELGALFGLIKAAHTFDMARAAAVVVVPSTTTLQ